VQVCNHPHLSYAQPPGADGADLARRCGKLAALDRMLVKLHATGHRVLLFSTMTRLLDLLEARGLCGARMRPAAPRRACVDPCTSRTALSCPIDATGLPCRP